MAHIWILYTISDSESNILFLETVPNISKEYTHLQIESYQAFKSNCIFFQGTGVFVYLNCWSSAKRNPVSPIKMFLNNRSMASF